MSTDLMESFDRQLHASFALLMLNGISLRDTRDGWGLMIAKPGDVSRDTAHALAVRDIVRAVVSSEVSHESFYLARFMRFDDSWGLWRLRRKRPRDEPLGFGTDEITALIVPVIWITINEAAREFGKSAGNGTLAALRALLRRLLHRKPKSAVIPPLTRLQQEKVCEMVQEELLKVKLSPHRAESIANAVFRELSRGFATDGCTEPKPSESTDSSRAGHDA